MKRCLLACLLLGPLPVFAEAPPTPADLVRQLGDESFEVRREAAEKLVALGTNAESAVRAGLEDRDVEVRRRCRALLPRLLRADREGKFNAFLADVEDRQKHDLPGWARFGKLAGTGAAGRQLFVRAQRAEAAFLAVAERDPKAASATLASRCAGLQLKAIDPEQDKTILGEVAALAFVATGPGVALPPRSLDQLFAGLETLANREALRKQVKADAALRKLLAATLRERSGGSALAKGLHVALELELKEAVDWGMQIATDRKADVGARAMALLLLGGVGDKGLAPRLKPLLCETARVGTRRVGPTTLTAELRDVALATLVRLEGGNVADYGYPYLRALPGLKGVPEPSCLGFASDAQRAAALKRWEEHAGKK